MLTQLANQLEAEKRMVFDLTMRVKKLEAECAALQQKIDGLEGEVESLKHTKELLVNRNGFLVKELERVDNLLRIGD
jgi:uncharacterized protein YceH (UPF0502 family)